MGECYVIVVRRCDWMSKENAWTLVLCTLLFRTNFVMITIWPHVFPVIQMYTGNYHSSLASDNTRNISSYFDASSNYFETYNNRIIKHVFTYQIQRHNNERNGCIMHITLVGLLVCFCYCYCWENRIEFEIFTILAHTHTSQQKVEHWKCKVRKLIVGIHIPLIAMHLNGKIR